MDFPTDRLLWNKTQALWHASHDRNGDRTAPVLAANFKFSLTLWRRRLTCSRLIIVSFHALDAGLHLADRVGKEGSTDCHWLTVTDSRSRTIYQSFSNISQKKMNNSSQPSLVLSSVQSTKRFRTVSQWPWLRDRRRLTKLAPELSLAPNLSVK